MRLPKLITVLIAGCVLAALTPLGTAQAASGPTIDPTSLTNGGRPCSAATTPAVLGGFASYLQAAGSDETYTYSGFDYTFTIWPLADPGAARSVIGHAYDSGGVATARVPADVLIDGGSYAWRVQLTTSNGTSPWSQVCTFSYDYTAPAAPSISSANYPSSSSGNLAPIGQFAQFTFDAGGDQDTAGFAYNWNYAPGALACSGGSVYEPMVCPDFLSGPGIVRLASPGGTASITLNPVGHGPQALWVAALDVAGNWSPTVRYETYVPYSGPTVTQADSHPICGNIAKVVFSPHPGLTPVSSYTYRFDQGPTATVPADADGTAQVSIKENREPGNLQVTSTGTNGFRSSEANIWLNVNPQVFVHSSEYPDYGQPAGGVGKIGTFSFQPPFSEGPPPTAFSYRFSNGPTRTVAATDEFGGASVHWAPTRAGQQTLTVQSINADGSPATCTTSYTFTVAR
ncbi:MAG: hypothetical protein QOE53_470 [Pseudonocardiales bacterium]|jgi:hypothetical protein|nr:hypothetical protein [Pseudonocardiales bacterium]